MYGVPRVILGLSRFSKNALIKTLMGLMAYGHSRWGLIVHAWQFSGSEDPRQTRYLIYEQRTETSTTPSGPGGFQRAPVDRLGLATTV